MICLFSKPKKHGKSGINKKFKKNTKDHNHKIVVFFFIETTIQKQSNLAYLEYKIIVIQISPVLLYLSTPFKPPSIPLYKTAFF
jgi:hypothetical protein